VTVLLLLDPLRAIVCGEFAASSVTVMLAPKVPVVAGVKVAETIQFAPAASVAPQGDVEVVRAKSEASAPPSAMLEMFSVALPVLLRVTLETALVTPTAVAGKAMLGADSDTAGATPVPVSAIVCGEPETLSVMETVALYAVAAAGVKDTEIMQDAADASVVPQVFVSAKSAGFVPPSAMLVMLSVALPVLLSVTICTDDVDPVFTPVKVRDDADSITSGDVPTPLSPMLCVLPETFPLLSVTVTVAA